MATTESVESVHFKFLTDDEVRSHSVVKITNTELVDTIGSAVAGGLYDSAMGPLDDLSLCSSCGQRSYQCPGHCGHIDLVSPVYNPLLFSMLSNLLNITCFTCFQFRDSRGYVEGLVKQLNMISKGDIIGAKKLQALKEGKELDLSIICDIGGPEPVSDTENPYDSNLDTCWDSCQLTEAMSVLSALFKRKVKKCKNCECNNPKITKPTFGWFHMSGLSSTQIRSNAIRGSRLSVADSRGGSDKHSSEVIDDSGIAEANSYEAIPITEKQGKKGVIRRDFNENSEDPTNCSSGPLLPSQVKDILRCLWKNEAPLCSYICNVQQHQRKSSGNAEGYSMFFLDTVLVPPTKFRPPAKGGDTVMEHPHTVLLGKVLQSNIALGNAHLNNAEHSKIINRWMDLQQSINILFDSKTASSQAQKDAMGICQYLEKKEGIFRQKMMGKRVNFACRSVISPDPYLAVNEIGIPPYFALRLTYPERVTPWNAEKLRVAVMNGPEIYPGAISYADSVATLKLAVNKNLRAAISRRLPSSRGAVSQIRKNGLDFEGKIVYRHLQDGDIVLVNRQPTLHKPSIMAHVVRVLKGEKTLRMHYANCSSYNADFDGDEINVHFPQDEISRAEAYNIVNANEQYIVPTKGDTVRGLIQDHIVGAVLLTLKNTFLNHTEFSQLLYGSGVFTQGSGLYPRNNSRKVSLVEAEDLVESVLPTIWKPEPLWTGKQVITALLNHITRGCAPCTVKNQGKVPKNYYAGSAFKNGDEDEHHNAEHNLLIWKNELLRGVIDKAQFGKFGLVHTIQELYGSNSAGILLSALSRLFTVFLQFHGFTCGMDDLIILPDYDAKRKKKLEGEDVGEEVHCDFVKFKPGQIGPEELQLEVEKVICQDRESATASLDMKMKNKLTNRLTREGSQILKHLLTAGLLKPFPKNCISVMTTTGAKGSTVNFQQISAYLGQQELEGKRVPRMVSGKTLPSFPPWDFTSRAGGFITDRFLTGLRPQEYYFHCMAGREGLVDTAVKTSRSGYLQRCLIKNLESLKVSYDYTVRDSDGSIVQFFYGEDGIDAHKTSFLNNFKALEDNQETLVQKFKSRREFDGYIKKLPKGLEKEARKFIQEKQDNSSVKQKGSGMEHSHKKQSRKNQEFFLELVEQKYLSSLVQAGEPVGVIAAQSIGEPSTQMTLNTFHLAGRGEMNVTLGIPRLQEILMTASDVIKTPILTCPFSEWRSKNYVVSLVSSVKKVSVADLVESMDVQISVNQSKVYKLTITLKDSEFVSLRDTRETMKSAFLRELEDAIENHVIFLSKVSGIKNYASSSRSEATNEGDDDDSGGKRQEMNDDDDDDDEDDDKGDDLGADMQNRKQQATDEIDYDGPDDSSQGSEQSAGVESGDDDSSHPEEKDAGVESDDDDSSHPEEKDGDAGDPDDSNETSPSQNYISSKTKSRGKKVKKATKGIEESMEGSSKKVRRAIYVDCNGRRFEVHFRFVTEPHLLIAQLAQKTAKKVFIKRSGKSKISKCKVVQYDPDEKTVIWDDDKKPNKGQSRKQEKGEETLYWAMKASGVDFRSIWEMYDDLDLSRLYSNNIHAVLRTYGVEAARATIIREVKQVFDIYGVKIDFRHLSLIADYMTHTGGYRPFSRHGSIAQSLSPFLKMSFETASKFIVEAASHGLADNLETPSSRICLGLPAKVGTGCFDLMQKLEV